MKIRLRLSDPIKGTNHQQFVLVTAFRDTASALVFYGESGQGYFPKNPFTFNDDGTCLEAELADDISPKNVQEFKQMVMNTINHGLRGHTTRAYEPPSDFPKVQVKKIDVESEQEKMR